MQLSMAPVSTNAGPPNPVPVPLPSLIDTFPDCDELLGDGWETRSEDTGVDGPTFGIELGSFIVAGGCIEGIISISGVSTAGDYYIGMEAGSGLGFDTGCTVDALSHGPLTGTSSYRLAFAVGGCWQDHATSVTFKLVDGSQLIATKVVDLVLPPEPDPPWHRHCRLSGSIQGEINRTGRRTNNGAAHYASATIYRGAPARNGIIGGSATSPYNTCVVGAVESYPSRYRGSVTQTATLRVTGGPGSMNGFDSAGPTTCNLSFGTCNQLKTASAIWYVRPGPHYLVADKPTQLQLGRHSRGDVRRTDHHHDNIHIK